MAHVTFTGKGAVLGAPPEETCIPGISASFAAGGGKPPPVTLAAVVR